MIALFVTDSIPCHLVTTHLFDVRPRTDGPFAAWEGETRAGRAIRVYQLAQRVDDAYVAGRLAARWGEPEDPDSKAGNSTLLFYLTTALAARGWMEQENMTTGDLVVASPIYDLRGFEDLQRMLPDTASELPIEFPKDRRGPARPVGDFEGPKVALGSLALPLTVPMLSDVFHKELGIGLFDRGAAGIADAASEVHCSAIVAAIVAGVVQPASRRSAKGFAREARLKASVSRFVEETGLDRM